MRFEDRGLQRRVERLSRQGQIILDEQVLRDSNYYAPQDTGSLIESGVRSTNPGTGKIIWDMAYSRRLYYNPQYNFSRDKNPNAQGLWFEAAKSRHAREWANTIKKSF